MPAQLEWPGVALEVSGTVARADTVPIRPRGNDLRGR